MQRAKRAIIMAVAILAVSTVASATHTPSAHATLGAPLTSAFLDSEPGDYVGQGQQLSFTTVVPAVQGDVIMMQVSSVGHFFTAALAPVSGQPFTTGTYENAQRAFGRAAGHPGLDVFGDGRGCNTVAGRFIVDEISFNGDGTVATFSARFEQHCEGFDPALFGAVSYQATADHRSRSVSPNILALGSVVVGQTSAMQNVTITNNGPSDLNVASASLSGPDSSQFNIASNTCGAAITTGNSCTLGFTFSPLGALGPRSAKLTFFDELAPSGGGGTGRDVALTGQAAPSGTPFTEAWIDSEQGDPVGNGQQLTFTTVTPGSFDHTTVHLTATSAQHSAGFTFSAPSGSNLADGTYEDAKQFPTGDTHPGLTVAVDSSICNGNSFGRFIIDQISFDAGGNLLLLSARAEWHCNGADAAVFGAVSYHATSPFRTRANANSVDFGSFVSGQSFPPQTFTITNQGPSSLTMTGASLSGPDVAQFGISSNDCVSVVLAQGQSCSITFTFAPTTSLGLRTAVLTFFDELAPNGGGGTGRDIVLTGRILDPTGEFTPLTPVRILDTRTGTGHSGKVGSGQAIALVVDGAGGVPADQVSAVVMNVTATNTVMPYVGYLTVYPDDPGPGCPAPPTAANLNFAPGETRPNLVTVKVGPNGAVCLFNGVGSIDLIADVMGYYSDAGGNAGSRFHGTTPTRRIDTRFGTGAPHAKIAPHGVLSLDVRGVGGVPSTGVTAIVMNVTVTNPTPPLYGWLTAYPGDVGTVPLAANLNFAPGQTVPNLVIVRVPTTGPATGIVKLANGDFGSIDVVVDVVGYYDQDRSTEAGRFVPVDPSRVFDTRFDFDGLPLFPDDWVVVDFGTGLSAVVTNVAITAPDDFGWLTAFPGDESLPLAANLNWTPGLTVPNLIQVKVGGPPDGSVVYANGDFGTVHVICDFSGFFTDASGLSASSSLRAAARAGAPEFSVHFRKRVS